MKIPLLAAITALMIAAIAQRSVRQGLKEFARVSEIPSTPFLIQDIVFCSAGMRSVAADLAWLQMLRYMADDLPDIAPTPNQQYGSLYTLALRVARLDPSFHRAYLYGASILAWFNNVDRPDEAIKLLEEGLRRDPGQPLYSVYIAALAYKKKGDVNQMVSLLETTLQDPHSPIEMKAILANLYKSRGEYDRALTIWYSILDNPDEKREWPRARVQVSEIRRILKDKANHPHI